MDSCGVEVSLLVRGIWVGASQWLRAPRVSYMAPVTSTRKSLHSGTSISFEKVGRHGSPMLLDGK